MPMTAHRALLALRHPAARRALCIALSVALLCAVACLPRPGGAASRCLGVAALMATLWATEAIPLAVTALAPVAFFPLLGIAGGSLTASQYFDSISCVCVSGFLVAAAVEKWGLHERMSLRAVALARARPCPLLLGLFGISLALSMWLSNTSTALLLYPNALAMARALRCAARVERALLLAVAWGSSLGGMATLVGTPTNMVFARVYAAMIPSGASDVSFGKWMQFAMPCSLALGALSVGVLWAMAFLPERWAGRRSGGGHVELRETDSSESTPTATQAARAAQRLPRMCFEELCVLALFLLVAVLWSFRSDMRFGSFVLPGWSRTLAYRKLIDDGTVGVAVALVFFLIPGRSSKAVKELPWDVLLLFGGGLALAKGFLVSGLGQWLSTLVPTGVPPFVAILASCSLAAVLTQVMSNISCASILMPILGGLAEGLRVHPILLMVPVAITCSLSLATPVACVSNVIVFASGKLRVVDVLAPGALVCLLGVLVISGLSVTLLPAVFGVWAYPADPSSST
eukprot:m51a1_g12217 hypothetical protein (517) ;mRNA; r:21620-23510